MDRIAAEGTEFTRFHVSPVCAPTRSALLTGRYNVRCGVHGVTAGRETMRSEETTIAEALRPAGYSTALYGKWHLGEHYPYVPHAQGFDEFIGFRTGHWVNYWDSQFERNGQPYPMKGYVTEALTGHALRFMDSHRTKPFFLYLAYNVPHTPFQVPERYWKQFASLDLDDRTKAVYALTKCLDDQIGRLMKQVDDNTLVVFLSDNGPAGQRYNVGLRGAKGSVYEGGTRVPFLVRWPGRVPAGKRVDRIAAHIDVYPTLLDVCGVTAPKGFPIDGRSLMPLVNGTATNWPDRPLFVHAERPADPSAVYPGAVRTQRFNLVNGKELYDVSVDPGETNDVSAKEPGQAARLKAVYEDWFRDALPPGGFKRLPIPVGYTEENPVKMKAPQAYLSGGARFHGGNGFAHDWAESLDGPQAQVAWDIDVVTAGRYQVTLLYLASEPGLDVKVSAATSSIDAKVPKATSMEPKPARDVLPRAETPEMNWGEMRAGVLEIPKGRTRLTVRAPKTQLKEVWLERL